MRFHRETGLTRGIIRNLACDPADNDVAKVRASARCQHRSIFNQSCAACHDTLGASTKSGPELKSYYHYQPQPADATVRMIIQQGKDKMPAFNALNKSRINDLIAFLKTL